MKFLLFLYPLPVMDFPIAETGSISAAMAAMPTIAELTGTEFFYFSADYPSGIRQDQ